MGTSEKAKPRGSANHPGPLFVSAVDPTETVIEIVAPNFERSCLFDRDLQTTGTGCFPSGSQFVYPPSDVVRTKRCPWRFQAASVTQFAGGLSPKAVYHSAVAAAFVAAVKLPDSSFPGLLTRRGYVSSRLQAICTAPPAAHIENPGQVTTRCRGRKRVPSAPVRPMALGFADWSAPRVAGRVRDLLKS